MASEGEAIALGKLRWLVTIATRTHTQGQNAGLVENFAAVQQVHADIQPIGAQTWLQGAQTDTPVTHRIFMRWLPWVGTAHVIVRQTVQPDGTNLEELYRIRRAGEWRGRKRFLMIEAEQEFRQVPPS